MFVFAETENLIENTTAALAEQAHETNDFFRNLFNTIGELAADYALKIVLAVLILLIGIKLANFLVILLNKTRLFKHLDEGVRSFLSSAVRVTLYVVLFVTAATEVGVPATSFVTVLASAGLAIGLALQGSLGNFAGGLMLLIFKPFKIGDYVSAGGSEGFVREINIFYTTLETFDNRVVTIPNGTLSNTTITDFTAKDERRVDLNIGVSYKSDVQAVHKALAALMKGCDLILSDPAPQSRLVEYADSSIVFQVRAWCKAADYWTVYFYLQDRFKSIFEENGIEIPFPQMDVHLDK